MHTRKDYLNNLCTFREYYSQFVDQSVKNKVAQYIGVSRIVASTDEHLNDIPLKEWDILSISSHIGNKMRECGDFPTLAGNVCIHKEAARQLQEEQ